MKLETERLEIALLSPAQLRLWISDLPKLEAELSCSYRGEAVDGEFGGVVAAQAEISEKDPDNRMWRSFWFIIRKSDRVAVGSADFKAPPDADGRVEIGYGLAPEFEHLGYMTETVRAMCALALAEPGVSEVIAETEKWNSASQRVLARAGFEEFSKAGTLWWRLSPDMLK